jgi:hypothetical protein
VQDVPYEALRERLVADGQVLRWQGAVRKLTGLDPAVVEGIVVDDADARYEGVWTVSTSVSPFVGYGYRHDQDAQKGEKSARFEIVTPSAGRYVVQLAYTAHGNRATAVPVRVTVAGETVERRVDQTATPPVDGLWTALGELALDADDRVAVVVATAGTDGHVVVDAVRLLPVTR